MMSLASIAPKIACSGTFGALAVVALEELDLALEVLACAVLDEELAVGGTGSAARISANISSKASSD
jgi:hypothetical protein